MGGGYVTIEPNDNFDMAMLRSAAMDNTFVDLTFVVQTGSRWRSLA